MVWLVKSKESKGEELVLIFWVSQNKYLDPLFN